MQETYEKIEKEFEQGEILRNFNGKDYRVLERFSKQNLLLMDVKSGDMVVGISTELYAMYPKGENKESKNCSIAISWGHGIYLGATPSNINFRDLREEYGTKQHHNESNTPMIYEVEIKEHLSRVIEIEASSMDEAIDSVRDQYYDEKIILDSEDMKQIEFMEFGVKEIEKKQERSADTCSVR